MTEKLDLTPQYRRLDRADSLGEQLAASIQSWATSEPMESLTRIADDRLSWQLILKVRQHPPVEAEWAFLFGEAIHNLRSALDNLAVSVAQSTGITDPKALKRVQFPISATQVAWKADRARIASLPDGFKAAIESVQPFQRESKADIDNDLLLILRDLSNQDKHHLQVAPAISTLDFGNSGVVEFETEEGAAASTPPVMEMAATNFRDETILLTQRTKGRIAKVNGEFNISAQVQVQLVDGRQEGITHILAALCFYTRHVMNYLGVAVSE